MELKEFTELINEFVTDNFRVESRDENAEIEIDDYKGSYNKTIIELFKQMGFFSTCFLERCLSSFLNKKITKEQLEQQYKNYTDMRDM